MRPQPSGYSQLSAVRELVITSFFLGWGGCHLFIIWYSIIATYPLTKVSGLARSVIKDMKEILVNSWICFQHQTKHLPSRFNCI